MANKGLFKSIRGMLIPSTNTVNHAGAVAYQLSPKQALAQLAATGCLNSTYYESEHQQLSAILSLCQEVDSDFIARAAIYSHRQGSMKDVPALLCAVLSVKDQEMFKKTFPLVISNGKMLRNFVQTMRSGVVGRKSLGRLPKRLVVDWLQERTDEALFADSVGNSPSISDILKMVHPVPRTKNREALYGYLLGNKVDRELLPEVIQRYEAFLPGVGADLSQIPFRLVTHLALESEDWIEIARTSGWKATLMNLNTFARHGVFEADESMANSIASRLRNGELLKKAKVFPYQIMMAYYSLDEKVPLIIYSALQDALEMSLQNIPEIESAMYVCVDVSGSMSSPITGHRKGSTSKVRCVDVAALVASAFLRKNQKAQLLPFHTEVISLALNPRDTVLTNAEKLARVGGGGTNCSSALAALNRKKARGDLVIFLSDNESWMDPKAGRGTEMMHQWNMYKDRNRKARLVCVDLQPNRHSQVKDREDILNIGGFSDQVFTLIEQFHRTSQKSVGSNYWIQEIDRIVM